MKVRDSGMPEQDYWESLFQIDGILDGLAIDTSIRDAVEMGCGYGTFTLPVAQRIRGKLHAFDIEPGMIELTKARAESAGVRNLNLAVRDVVTDGFGLSDASVDAVLLFNILHLENPVELLRIAARVVCVGGRVLAIHWRSDVATPRGPALSIRPQPEQVAEWGTAVGFALAEVRVLAPWHFGVVLTKLNMS